MATSIVVRIFTKDGRDMQKATGLLMDRNDLGPSFVEWETDRHAVIAKPETVEDTAKLIQEIHAAGFRWQIDAEKPPYR